ncbi:MAG: metallophosphoesterase family protein [Desulfobacterales bacterium]
MKTAILSDIHGNATALEAVLKDVDAQACDQILSLGDNIGYGRNRKVIQMLRARNIPSVTGNHELGATRLISCLYSIRGQKINQVTDGMLSPSTSRILKNSPTLL